jgi:YHS domain-containing protein
MPKRRAMLALLLLAPGIASGQTNAATPVFAERGIALGGTDAVAYFTQGRAVAGLARHTFSWRGATWRFANEANRDAFAADPEKYAPQYGGFCAWAVAQGYHAPTDRNAWKIVDGKLYLNYDRSIQRRWEGDVPGNISKADGNWPEVARTVAGR